MKQFLTLLIAGFVFLALSVACSSESEISEPRTRSGIEYNSLEIAYNAARQTMIDKFNSNMKILSGNSSAVPAFSKDIPIGVQYAIFVSKIDKMQLDEMSKKYCSDEEMKKYEDEIDNGYEYLLENSSDEEVAYFIDFTHDYYLNGGRDLRLVGIACEGKTQIIQRCIVNAAAYIDLFIPDTNNSEQYNTILKAMTGGQRYCLGELLDNMGNNAAGDLVVGGILSGFGPVGALIDAGLSMYATIKLAYQFDNCMATHV